VKKKQWVYLLSLVVLGLILVLYYGSWEFYDNPDPRSHTIGNSYVRYWLPIYLGALPLAVYFWLWFTRHVVAKRFFSAAPASRFFSFASRRQFWLIGLRALGIGTVLVVSLTAVGFGSAEGLYYAREQQRAARFELAAVTSLTESSAVIITQYHDKLFFPERKVLVGLFDDPNLITVYARLVKLLPVYYYNFTLPPSSFNYLNNSRLFKYGLRIDKVKSITPDFALYKLIAATSTEIMRPESESMKITAQNFPPNENK
jgi:hypothetical protein